MFTRTLLLLAFLSNLCLAQQQQMKMAKMAYQGGGDWYANKTALPNLSKFCNDELNTNFEEVNYSVEVASPEIFDYAFIYMTGHGNVVFSDAEANNLRKYLLSGGFLHIDDNYGLDAYIRLEMKKVFPELEFVELPFDHEIYNQKFEFENGLPKIHQHDNKPPQGFGLIYEGRLVCFYSYESDLGNGWEDQRVHNDPPSKRLEALQMGANIISYAFVQY